MPANGSVTVLGQRSLDTHSGGSAGGNPRPTRKPQQPAEMLMGPNSTWFGCKLRTTTKFEKARPPCGGAFSFRPARLECDGCCHASPGHARAKARKRKARRPQAVSRLRGRSCRAITPGGRMRARLRRLIDGPHAGGSGFHRLRADAARRSGRRFAHDPAHDARHRRNHAFLSLQAGRPRRIRHGSP